MIRHFTVQIQSLPGTAQVLLGSRAAQPCLYDCSSPVQDSGEPSAPSILNLLRWWGTHCTLHPKMEPSLSTVTCANVLDSSQVWLQVSSSHVEEVQYCLGHAFCVRHQLPRSGCSPHLGGSLRLSCWPFLLAFPPAPEVCFYVCM